MAYLLWAVVERSVAGEVLVDKGTSLFEPAIFATRESALDWLRASGVSSAVWIIRPASLELLLFPVPDEP